MLPDPPSIELRIWRSHSPPYHHSHHFTQGKHWEPLSNHVRDADCDAIQQQFRSFVNEVVPANSTTFKDFNPDNERLDTFLAVYLKCTQYEKRWMVTKKLLILSHGQPTVERGFSINSHVTVENLKEESLVAQRIVHDAITTPGGVCQMPVTKSMLSYAQGQKYMAYLEAGKKKVLKQNIQRNVNSK